MPALPLLLLHHRLIGSSVSVTGSGHSRVASVVGVALLVLRYLVEGHFEGLREFLVLRRHVAAEHHALAVAIVLALRRLLLDHL